jgi:hypothetical protein
LPKDKDVLIKNSTDKALLFLTDMFGFNAKNYIFTKFIAKFVLIAYEFPGTMLANASPARDLTF